MLIPVPPSSATRRSARLSWASRPDCPCRGETALITAGSLAAAGHLTLPAVIAIAVVAAISGDTLGYWLGRGRGRGRAFLMRDGFLAGHRRHSVERTERFLARSGSLTVFVRRFTPGVRVVDAVLAGATQNPWRRFAAANTLGAVLWATTVASLAYLLGRVAGPGWPGPRPPRPDRGVVATTPQPRPGGPRRRVMRAGPPASRRV